MGSLPPSATKPVIVVVPGSFSPTSFYVSMIDLLSSHGYQAICIDLPSVGRNLKGPAASMAEDAAYIKSVTSKLANAGKDVVIVTHSYGGVPGTESAKGLAKIDREAIGKSGGISRLFYMTSLVPPVGGSLKTLMGDILPHQLHVRGDYMWNDPVPTADLTFSDIPQSEGLAWANQMPEHSTISFAGELTYPAYKYILVSYLVCEADKIIPPQLQRDIVEMMSKESGRDIDVHVLQAGHCPNVSMPGAVVDAIMKATNKDV